MPKNKKFRDIEFGKLIVRLDFNNSIIYLETANHKLVGSSEWFIDKKEVDMFVSDFGIESRYRGKGYGNFLARILIDLARLYHLKTITLIDGSTLKGFWQHLGFKDNKDNNNNESVLKL